ncbi:hypothetical protein KCP70_19335 [Salmonella enterica subsp. enterica]|nr:hypothetical protein KCP70_19335 [Salmonella enterica subsp. enterica]
MTRSASHAATPRASRHQSARGFYPRAFSRAAAQRTAAAGSAKMAAGRVFRLPPSGHRYPTGAPVDNACSSAMVACLKRRAGASSPAAFRPLAGSQPACSRMVSHTLLPARVPGQSRRD